MVHQLALWSITLSSYRKEQLRDAILILRPLLVQHFSMSERANWWKYSTSHLRILSGLGSFLMVTKLGIPSEISVSRKFRRDTTRPVGVCLLNSCLASSFLVSSACSISTRFGGNSFGSRRSSDWRHCRSKRVFSEMRQWFMSVITNRECDHSYCRHSYCWRFLIPFQYVDC